MLSKDFFVDLETISKTTTEAQGMFEGRDRRRGKVKSTGTRIDLTVGSNSALRSIVEAYGSTNSEERIVRDFVVP